MRRVRRMRTCARVRAIEPDDHHRRERWSTVTVMNPSHVTRPPRTGRRQGFPPHVAADTPLSKREQVFVDEYLVELKGAAAAIKAGYAERSARVTASRLLSKANIQAALEQGYAERRQRIQVTADAVVQRLAHIAFGNIAAMFDEQGRLRHLHDVPVAAQVAISSIEVVTKKTVSKGEVVDVVYVHKIRSRDAVRALEQLGKHLGILDGAGLPPPQDVPVFALPVDGPQYISVH